MKVWFDTEFIEDGRTIDLLSIGMVREDGKTLYLENVEADKSKANEWVRQNVLPKLAGTGWTRSEIRKRVEEFCGKEPEFWADYAAYDWVVLCQLFGPMMALPAGWPMHCLDVQQFRHYLQIPLELLPTPSFGDEHNALLDAINCRARWSVLMGKSLEVPRV